MKLPDSRRRYRADGRASGARLLPRLLLSALLVCGLPFGAGWTLKTAGADPRGIEAGHVPGEVIVKFKPEAGSRAGRVLAAGRLSMKHENAALGFKVLRLPPETTVGEAVERLSADPSVEYAEPNYLDRISYTPNDPLFPSQWNMRDFAGGGIDARAAWDTERGDLSVIIAVVDSGVAYEDYGSYTRAPDLAGTKFVSPYDAIDGDGHPNDPDGHGTHVTGTIAQTTDNAIGAAGAAHGCSVMPVRGIGTHAEMADAFAWAADHGAGVINYSAGGIDSRTKREGCRYAYERGVTICAASGNDNAPSIDYPAAYDEYCIAVGGTNRAKVRAFYSNYGPQLDLVGPGGDTRVTEDDGILQQTYVTEGDPSSGFSYRGWQGTSMSTPHVSAVAGLFISRTGISNPGAVKLQLERTARDLGGSGWDQYFGYGLVDAERALVPAAPLIQSLTPASATVGSTVTLSGLNFGEDRDGSIVSFNGTAAVSYPSWSDDAVRVVVPAGARSGKVAVTTLDGTGNGVDFTVKEPVPVISSISPERAAAGGPAFSLEVNGRGFTTNSTVRWNGANRTTRLVSEERLEADIPASDITEPGDAEVTVLNSRSPGGGVSNTAALTVGSVWHMAEGSTAWGFETYISILNPGPDAVRAEIAYDTEKGTVNGPEVHMPPRSRATVYPRETLGEADFSTRVACWDGGRIAADRTMVWTGPGAAGPEAHSSIGVAAPAGKWYLPEGSSAWEFECWLLVQNPGDAGADCRVTYMREGAPPVTVSKSVPAGSRGSFDISRDIGEADTSIMVTSSVPVIPERSMYRNRRRLGHVSIGTTTPSTTYHLAEGTSAWGFTTYLLVQNPNAEPSTVNVTHMTTSGGVAVPPFTMAAGSRKTLRVNDTLPGRDFSTTVRGSKPIIAERAMYWDSGTGEAAHDSIGMSAPHRAFHLPDGQVGDTVETWVLVQNPNPFRVRVRVDYLVEGEGSDRTVTATIAANSRHSFSMADAGVSGKAGIVVTSPDGDVSVERSMYINGRAGGTDTIGGWAD